MTSPNCGSPGTTTTISSPAQAIVLSPCSTYTGSIAVATSYQGELGFLGIKTITESLIASNSLTLTSLLSGDLETIGTSFVASSLTAITNISFPALKSAPVLRLEDLGPVLSRVNISRYDGPGNVTISQTWIENLDATCFAPTTLDSLTITQNQQLSIVDLASLAGTVNNLTIAQNSGDPAVNLSNVKASTNGVYLNQISTLDLNSLESVGSGGLSISASTMEALDLPSLTNTSSLFISQNSALASINLQHLHTITGSSSSQQQAASNQTSSALTIANNTLLTGEISLPSLSTLSGSASIIGNFTSLSLPQLQSLKSTFLLQSTANISSTCDHLTALTLTNTTSKSNSSQNITCIYPGHTPASASTEQPLTTASIAAASTAGLMLLFGLIACIILCFRRQKKKRREKEMEMRHMQSRSWRTLEEERKMMRAWPMYQGANNSTVGGF